MNSRSSNIGAWSAAHAVRYNFSDLPLKPRLGPRFDVTSGDNNPASPNLQTFNPLFPSGIYKDTDYFTTRLGYEF